MCKLPISVKNSNIRTNCHRFSFRSVWHKTFVQKQILNILDLKLKEERVGNRENNLLNEIRFVNSDLVRSCRAQTAVTETSISKSNLLIWEDLIFSLFDNIWCQCHLTNMAATAMPCHVQLSLGISAAFYWKPISINWRSRKKKIFLPFEKEMWYYSLFVIYI